MVVAEDGDAAGIGAQESGDDREQGGLAGTVGAKQAEDGAGRDVQTQIVDRTLAGEGLAQADDGDGGIHRSRTRK